ncbi:TetR/AcrR family transcriptional regulator [Neisseriaceae bacterium B2N2-7]|uniref:TetR/AcrR family transcriptional regulator n=2 Tax=Craterilacuibacter sinensis TaxID=2686017 RepID=A0A845BPD3_9NEIS|nr:TetR/AcrR family transcriptional regulator [Craterilacuibacter sinensis]
MTRPRTVDRERLLESVEQVVSTLGPSGLTFGAVATTSGLSKATVQSVFASREGMIEALLERWLQQERMEFEQRAGDAPTLRDRVRAHIQTVLAPAEDTNSRLAASLAALASTNSRMEGVMQWYADRMGDFSAKTDEERHLRMLFLAAEGAFFVRYLAKVPISAERWQEIAQDLQGFAQK